MADSNQKPCNNCRRRKVRCDKQIPCANCVRSSTRCLYEDQADTDGLAPLVLDKPTTTHLFDRLSGLEQMVSKLSEVHLQSNGYVDETKNASRRPPESVSNSSHDDFNFPLAQSRSPPTLSQQDFPSLEESNMLIQLFLELTEPFIRLIHVPFFLQQLKEYRDGQMPLYFEAMLPSIHALALATLSSNFVLEFFRRPRDELLVLVRRKAEEALTQADFMRSQQPIVLRGLLYFINFLFEVGDSEYASSLVGVALRVALRIGLHHELKDTTAFVRDVRRRLWHQLQHLDHRAANLLGIESMMKPEWDTPPPKNALDETWEGYRIARDSLSGEPPVVTGYADTSFILARADIKTLQQQIRSASMTYEQMIAYIDGRKQELWRQYLSNTGSKPLQRFMVALLEIHIGVVYLTARQAHHKEASEDFRSQTFLTAIELLEQISAAEAEMDYIQYRWVLRTFIPIRAVITVLTCTLFQSIPECEYRSWQQIEKLYARYDNPDCWLAKTPIFEPINALREQALEVKREREMQMQL